MKKKVILFLLALTIVTTLIIAPASTIIASAASYPTVIHKSTGMQAYCGDTVPLIFTYFPAYNYEKITINIYSPSGNLKANSVFDVNNKYTNYNTLTSTWNTTGYDPGTYSIEIIKEFYSFYSWHTAPSKGSSSITLVKPTSSMSLKNPYTGSATHFEVRNDTTVTAKSKTITSAYNAWKKLNVTNVSNPYQIQMTEMYVGDEAEKIAVSENTYNANKNSSCHWILTKFEIKNNGSSDLKASESIDWTNAYLPTGEEATLIDICTFGDLPDYSTVIAPGETKEAWFGFYVLKSQGIPFLKLDNGAYISTHPNCSKEHRYSNNCDRSCNVCHAPRIITHSYKTTITKATFSKNGSIVKKCTVCGNVANTAIKYAKTFMLSTTAYSYSGGVKTPSVTVKNSAGKTLKKNIDYTVTYSSGRKNVGTYKATIKGKGNYIGTKTLNFKINPAKTTVSKLTAGKKSITVAITKKSTQVTGYQIQYSTSKKFSKATTKTISSYKATKHTLKGLSAKKTYYVRVRTYKTLGKTKYYSGWSTYKYVKTK